MRTKVLNHFHTFHPEAQARYNALVEEESRLSMELARRGEVDVDNPPKRRRMSEPLEDLEGTLQDVREKMDEQRKIIASGVVRIVIKGLTRGEFRRLLSDHPPREGDDLDSRVGYNSDTFGDELIKRCILRTEDLDSEPVPNRWDEWADEMTNGQWEEVFRACLNLTNEGSPRFPQ